jgi:hypothetical protein
VSLVHFPYRWGPDTFLDNLRGGWLDIRYGVRNLSRWFWTVWYDDDGDYDCLLEFMRRKLEFMRDEHAQNDALRSVNWKQDVQNMTICIELLKRIVEGQAGYFRRTGFKREGFSQSDHRITRYAKHSRYMEDQDCEMLGRIFSKWVRCWWT